MTLNGSDNFSVISLEKLNDDEAKQYLGGTVFVGVLMVIGVIGNLHVIYVYAFKLRPCNLRVFILCLGFVDILTCSVGMPFVVYDLTHPLMFYARFVCKALRFLNYFNSSASALLLMLVSIERYRKICVPMGRQLSERSSKICCGLVLILALLMSWPAPLLYGQSSVSTKYENVTGSKCFTEDKFKETPYQAYFNIFLIFIFIVTSVVLVVLYVLVAKEIFRNYHFRIKYIRKVNYGSKASKTIKASEDTKHRISQKPNNFKFYLESESDTATKLSDVSNSSDSKTHPQNERIEAYQMKQTKNVETNGKSDIDSRMVTLDEEQYTANTNNDDFDNIIQTDTKREIIFKNLDSYTHRDDYQHMNAFLVNITSSNYSCGQGQDLASAAANEILQNNITQSSTSSYGNTPVHDTYSNRFTTTAEHNGFVNPIFAISTNDSDMPTFREVNKSSTVLDSSFNKPNMASGSSSDWAGGAEDIGETITHLEPCSTINTVTPTIVTSYLKNNSVEAVTKERNGQSGLNRYRSGFDPAKEESTKTKRITLILFMITLVYFCSFLPHLILKILVFVKRDYLSSLTFSESFAYHTFVWSFFINNVANPFIYGFCDQKFREELKSLYCKCRR
ncbi:hypothetical protein ACJMK2_003893 [Sinanodonta woodiana]|uniref:G-protein coupled receptors family 1 profile domain-containing protein n=1 Tax=Sinanodonta woodiana TaxID=1069815 RepID=A0ABD3Y156_SINWO